MTTVKSTSSAHTPSALKTVILIEDTGSVSAHERAAALAKKTGFEVHKINPQKADKRFDKAQWQLVFTEAGLALRLSSEPSWSDIRVDFASAGLQYRKQHGGGRNEAIAKAIGIKGKQQLSVLDCTAGMGTDSFVMASVGAQVTMLERSPVIAALLEDALLRLEDAGEALHKSLSFVQADASEYLQQISVKEAPNQLDVIYLDPMFPHKKKSALVKKEMQAFQMLLGPDQDSEQLLTAAISAKPKRIVVKRPASAAELANAQTILPTMAIRSKKHRFDVYILKSI
ncbi:class I SAM-dependent methyltransferase [Glaciecola sp. SC05]|uniref:class I SAM-dependent methyltransferase n=1 Tax=Glaciecola sp. SC05 TaxID=1987355 RepID=UPI0035271BB6